MLIPGEVYQIFIMTKFRTEIGLIKTIVRTNFKYEVCIVSRYTDYFSFSGLCPCRKYHKG